MPTSIAELRSRIDSEIKRVTGGVSVTNTINKQRESQVRNELAAQRTKNLKLLMLGNLLPLHTPLRIAEELAVVDCISRGRVMAGFARGVPREYRVYNVPMSESRARFEEGMEIVLGAWTQKLFSYEGKFWQHKDISIWPRPYQQPHPPIWVSTTTPGGAGRVGARF